MTSCRNVTLMLYCEPGFRHYATCMEHFPVLPSPQYRGASQLPQTHTHTYSHIQTHTHKHTHTHTHTHKLCLMKSSLQHFSYDGHLTSINFNVLSGKNFVLFPPSVSLLCQEFIYNTPCMHTLNLYFDGTDNRALLLLKQVLPPTIGNGQICQICTVCNSYFSG